MPDNNDIIGAANDYSSPRFFNTDEILRMANTGELPKVISNDRKKKKKQNQEMTIEPGTDSDIIGAANDFISGPEIDTSKVDFSKVTPVPEETKILDISPDFKTVVTKEPLKDEEIKSIGTAFDDYDKKRKEEVASEWQDKFNFFGSFLNGLVNPQYAGLEPAWRDIAKDVIIPSIKPIQEGVEQQFTGTFPEILKETLNPVSSSNIKKIQGVANTVALPFGIGDYILRRAPGGEGVAEVVSAPFTVIDKVAETILEPIKFSEDENYDAELKGLIRTGAQFVIPMLVGKLLKGKQIKPGQILEDVARENPNAIKNGLNDIITNPYSGLEDMGESVGKVIKIPEQDRLISREGPQQIPKSSDIKTGHINALKTEVFEDVKKLKGFYDEADSGPMELSNRILKGIDNLEPVDLTPEITTIQNLSKTATEVPRLISEYNTALDINRKIEALRDFLNSPDEIPGLDVWRNVEARGKLKDLNREIKPPGPDVLGLGDVPANKVFDAENGKIPSFLQETENVSRETLANNRGDFMGGTSPFEVGGTQPVNEIDYLRNAVESAKKLPDKRGFRLIEEVTNNKNIFKDKMQGAIEALKGFGAVIWDKYSKLPEFGNYESSYGKWDSYNQMTRKAQVEFVDAMRKQIPQKVTREAIVNWIQADGDHTVLTDWFNNSNDRYKLGYKRALELTPKEIAIANSIKRYYDGMLYEGISNGLVRSMIDNYVTGIYKKKVPTGSAKELMEMANVSSTKTLQDGFGYARKKFYQTYFDAEQAGLVPFDKDISTIAALYDKAFNKVIADRKFIQDLIGGVAKDGRPLVVAEGTGNLVTDPNKPNDAVLVKTRGKGTEFKDYRVIENQPAMKDWKLTEVTDDGVPVLIKGDLAVHPEIYKRLKNTLGKSALYDFPVWKQLRKFQGVIKQSMLLLPMFHYVQEGTHAIGHTVNPFKVRGIDFNDPIVKYATEHELRLYDFNAANNFKEGLGFKGAIGRSVPILKHIGMASDFLFHEYIPSMKMDLWEHAYKRNMERYAKDVKAGKMTEEQIGVMTSRQANAAFGNLNYEAMGRNPTLQDFLGGVMLAPDFLEARTRFAAQTLKPYFWKEQARAIGLLGATMFVAARTLNKLLDDDYHWEEPFAVIVDGRKYRLRSVPEDLWEAYHDPTRFVYNRVSPFTKLIGELATHTDYRGAYISSPEAIKNALTSWIPLGGREVTGEMTKDLPEALRLPRNPDMSVIESFLSSLGLHGSKYYTATEKMINQRYKERFGVGTLPPDAQEKALIKKQIRKEIDSGNEDEAMKLYSQYREQGIDLDENSRKFFDNMKIEPILFKFKELSRGDQMEMISKMPDEEKNKFIPFVSGLKDQGTTEGQLIEKSTRRLQQIRSKEKDETKREEIAGDVTVNKILLYKLQTGEITPEQIRPLISDVYDFDSEFDNTKKNISKAFNENDYEGVKKYRGELSSLSTLIKDPDLKAKYTDYIDLIDVRLRDREGTPPGEKTPKQEKRELKIEDKIKSNKFYSPVQ